MTAAPRRCRYKFGMIARQAFTLFIFFLILRSAFAEEFRAITSRDRVLVLAPHPDDESLGAAGLIQCAVAAHARVCVVFATNGDNNAWAQRFVEHRWHIDATDRAR